MGFFLNKSTLMRSLCVKIQLKCSFFFLFSNIANGWERSFLLAIRISQGFFSSVINLRYSAQIMAPTVQASPSSKPAQPTTQFVFAPPNQFDFKSPSSWEKWIQRFERYREVSGLADAISERQVTTLIYCMGEDAEDILNASKLTIEEQKDYKLVKKMFTEFFIGKYNVIYECAKFHTRVQQENESIESFATDLSKLGEHCNYDRLLEEFIRDRIVIGIRDQQLSESLQLDAELTLEKAITKCRQKEAVRRQQTDLQKIGVMQASSAVDRIYQR